MSEASTQSEKDSNLWLFLHSIHGRTESFQAAPDSFSGSMTRPESLGRHAALFFFAMPMIEPNGGFCMKVHRLSSTNSVLL